MQSDVFLPRPQTINKVGLSASQIDRLEKVGKFPRRIQISERRVVWSEVELDEWMDARKAKRNEILVQDSELDPSHQATLSRQVL
ncbi:MAG: AlpA family phage regulatory protein [Amphiplicatus sp.]|nr:AlpA family phage regulatory protein [Amphiplicatus sp.]